MPHWGPELRRNAKPPFFRISVPEIGWVLDWSACALLVCGTLVFRLSTNVQGATPPSGGVMAGSDGVVSNGTSSVWQMWFRSHLG